MRPVKHLPNYTYDDYLLWEGDWEMIDGIPYAMSPSPTRRHQWISTVLTMEIVTRIRDKDNECKKCHITQDVDWIIDSTTVVRPDIAVVCQDTGDFITVSPALIVEIVSPTSGHKDRIIKHEIYEEQGVKYYIIIDPASNTYTAFHLLNGKYIEYNLNSYSVQEGCNITLDIKPF